MTNDTPLIPELLCSDLSASLTFYLDILGFSIEYERPESGFAMLARQGAKIMLEQIVAGSDRSWAAATLERPFGRGVNLQIATTGVDLLYETVRASGARIFLPIETRWYRAGGHEVGNRQFIVLDPDGYMLRFFESMGTRALTG